MKKFIKSQTTRNQFFAAFIVNLISLSHGCALGWLSPYISYLRSTKTHLISGPVTSENLSWIGSLIALGGIVGVFSYGKISTKFGLKISLILLVIPHYVSWILILLSTQVHHLYIARICSGLTGGGTLRNVSLYIAEISENSIRGKLCSLLMLFLSSGTLLIFITGTYFSFFVTPLVIMVLPAIFLTGVFFLPDTPASLLKRNRKNEAWSSLLFYRSCARQDTPSESIKEEFNLLQKTIEDNNYKSVELKDFTSKYAKKGLLVGLFLMFLNQCSGTMVVMTYTADIFKISGSDLTSNESSIVIAFIQLFGTYVSTLCVEKFGRKCLMIVSCSGSAVFLTTLGTFLYLKEADVNIEHFMWIPVVSLSLVIFLASLGIISLPFVIMTELLPNKIRSFASTICLLVITCLAFVTLKVFPRMVNHFKLYGCLWIFATVCLLGAIVTVISIPETKGKSLIASAAENDIKSDESLLSETKYNIQIIPINRR